MSKSVNKKILMMIMFVLLSVFMWGCGKSSVKVDNIYFNFESGEHVALMVGEELDLSNYVTIVPSFATNKEYVVSSLNEQVVSVEGKTIKALEPGYAIIKVVAKDNKIKESSIVVVVKQEKETLAKPQNLRYDETTQTILFDPVDFASSYTLRIDGEEIDLGAFTTYSMKGSSKQKLDKVQVVQVKANAAQYSQAFESSGFTAEFKIYQSRPAENFKIENGFGVFGAVSANSEIKVLIDDEVLIENLKVNTFGLNGLNEKFAGREVKISVLTKIKDSLKDEIKADVYCSGITSVEKVKVLGGYDLSLNGNILEWTKDELISKYEVMVGSKKVADCVTNSYNLATLTDFDNSFNKETDVEVKAVLAGSSNIAKTTKANKIKIKKLTKPEIQFNQTKVEWSAVDYADGYSVEIKNIKTGSKLTSYMLTNSIDMKNYDAGEYSISVTAISNGEMQEDNFCYLPSKVSSKTFEKYETLSLSMENGFLKINDSDSGSYALEFDDAENNFITSEKSIDLNKMEFEAGINSVKVTKLGGDSNINGDSSEEFFFTQLEDLKDGYVSLQNSTISIAKSEINKNATIELVVYKVEGQTQTELFAVKNDSCQFNSTDDGVDHLLSAGKYVVKIYVLGDGSTSLSVRDGQGANRVSLQKEFEVLTCPTIDVDIANKTLTLSEIANAKSYLILDSENNELQNEPFNQYDFSNHDFETVSELKLYVQALGDGESFLDSYKSEEILIKQLTAPAIQFSSDTNKITKQDFNTQGVKEWLFKVNGEIVEEYDFLSAYEFDENVDKFDLSLTAVAEAGADNKFFINSEETKKTLTRISNEAIISVDGIENNLVIAPANHNQEFDIKLNIACNGQTYALTSVEEDGVLSDGELNFKYAFVDNEYVVELMQNNQPILEDMKQGFDVEVQFINISDGDDDLIDSNVKSQNGLELFKVENETFIKLNNNGQLEITNNKYSGQMSPILVIGNKEFKLNEAGTALVNDSVELPVEFNDGTYVVNLLSEQFEPLSAEFDSEFNVKVKYCKELESGSFADSDFSEVFTFAVEMSSSLERDEQTIVILNIQPTYTVDDYKLLIDGVIYDLAGAAEKNTEGNIVVNADFVFEKIANKTESTLINVVTIGGETSLIKKGGEIKIKQAEKPNFVSNKDNNSENNSAVVTLKTTNEYSAQYVVDCYENDILVFSENYYYDSAVDGTYLLNIDEKALGLSGKIEFKAYALVADQDGDVEVFNSSISEVKYTKLNNVSGISISDDLLTFNAVEHAVGYEIYVDAIKFNPQLITETSYDVSAIDTNCKLQIKAISKENGFTNSDLTTELSVRPLTNPTIKFVNGVAEIQVDIALASLLSSKNIMPQITDSLGKQIGIDVARSSYDVKIVASFTGAVVYIQPYVFMNYNSNPLSAEDVNFQLVVNSNLPGECYINSPKLTFNLYGLFAPIDVKRATNTENDGVEFITWSANPANVINGTTIAEKYILKVVKDGVDYYSNDPKLKFKTGEDAYSTYGDFITSLSANFPSFYDKDESGTLTEGDIEFNSGDYDVYVQAVPNTTIDGVTICGSNYSEACVFEIMEKPNLSVENGGIRWNSDASAAKYEIKVYQGDDLKAGQVNIVSNNDLGNAYDFNSAALSSGVYKVCVRAISNKESVLNSKVSEIYVYRLADAKSVRVDDGDLIFSANQYFNQAKIEFIKEGKKNFECYVSNPEATTNLENLSINSWEDYSESLDTLYEYKIAMDQNLTELLSGDYTLDITLLGNSNTQLGLINSFKSVNISTITTTRLGVNSYSVEKGVIKFAANDQYATYEEIGGEVAYSQSIDLNYSFGADCYCPDFWKNTIIYKIVVNNSHSIYAVDYYSLMSGIEQGLIADKINIDGIGDVVCLEKNASGEYQFINYNNEVKFNVLVNNELNLKDNGEIRYYSKNNIESILNLAQGGNYDVKIHMLGGDSFVRAGASVGSLTAQTHTIKMFKKYKTTTFAILDGKVNFEKQALIEGDEPVYRFEIEKDGSEKYIYYLYTGDEEYAAEVAYRYDGDVASDGWTQRFVKLTEYEKTTNNYVFDMSEEFGVGVLNVNLTILVGKVLDSSNVDYYLNSLPCGDKTIFKPADCDVTIDNGEICFNQSYIKTEQGNKYLQDSIVYEITIKKNGGNAQVYQIGKSSEGVTFVDYGNTHSVYYNIPKQYVGADGTYEIMVRPLPTSGAADVLNGTYIKLSGENYKTLSFERMKAVSNVVVNNGKIVWQADETVTDFAVLISAKNSGKQVMCRTGFEIVNQSSGLKTISLAIQDGSYDLYRQQGAMFIDENDTYSVEVYAIGDNQSKINSIPVLTGNVNRLQRVEKDSITTLSGEQEETSNGILRWVAVDQADYYEITLENNESHEKHMFTAVENEFDFINQNLDVGEYSVSIRAIGSNMLSAIETASSKNFVQLAKAENIHIVAAGADVTVANSGVVEWDSVEGCSKYWVVVTYNNGETYSRIVNENKMAILATINADFMVEIYAIMHENADNYALRSKSIYSGSMSNPAPVTSAKYYNASKEIVIVAELLNSDKIVISYNFVEYEQGGSKVYVSKDIEIPYNEAQNYKVKLRSVGEYQSVMVRVVRGNASSEPKTMDNIILNVFAYGEGKENNPYVITNSTHFLNISIYDEKNVYFKLGGNINMSGILSNVSEGYVLEEFKGILDGNNCAIAEFNYNTLTLTDDVSFENQTRFALFGELNGATIKNLNIGKEGVDLTITNTISQTDDQSLETDLTFAMLAINSINSNIQNVNLKHTKLIVVGEGKLKGNVQIGGLIANVTGGTVANCGVDFKLDLRLDFNNTIAERINISGLVAIANETRIVGDKNDSDDTVCFEMEDNRASDSFTINNIAGLVAHGTNLTIENVKTEVKVVKTKTVNFGGAVSFASNVSINSCDVNVVFGGASDAEKYSVYLTSIFYGGVIGYADMASSVNETDVQYAFNIDFYGSNKNVNKLIGFVYG